MVLIVLQESYNPRRVRYTCDKGTTATSATARSTGSKNRYFRNAQRYCIYDGDGVDDINIVETGKINLRSKRERKEKKQGLRTQSIDQAAGPTAQIIPWFSSPTEMLSKTGSDGSVETPRSRMARLSSLQNTPSPFPAIPGAKVGTTIKGIFAIGMSAATIIYLAHQVK